MVIKRSARTVDPARSCLAERQVRGPLSIVRGQSTEPRSGCRAFRATACRPEAKSAAPRAGRVGITTMGTRANRRTRRRPGRACSSYPGTAAVAQQGTAASLSCACASRRSRRRHITPKSSRCSRCLSRFRTSSSTGCRCAGAP